jgi:hypothetical protein
VLAFLAGIKRNLIRSAPFVELKLAIIQKNLLLQYFD